MAANNETVARGEGAVIGNRELMERLDRDIRSGQLSHAYILDGREGSGRHTIARHICAAIACENRPGRAVSSVEDADQMGFFDFDEPPPPREIPADAPLPCRVCPACRKTLEDKCPDICFIGRDGKASIGVDAVRFLKRDVLIPPNDLDTKIYVIEDAHTMTEQAQNALLLTLEEPPAFVLFLLLAERADVLLETIRSRAPVIRMQPVPEQELSAWLLSPQRPTVSRAAKAIKEANGAEYTALLRMSNGRIGRAVELLEEKKRAPMLARRHEVTRLCELLADGTRPDALLMLLLSFGKMREEIVARLMLMQEALRDLMALGCTEDAPLIFFTERERAADLSAAFTASTLLSHIHATQAALTALSANANTRLVLTQYLCRLTQADGV